MEFKHQARFEEIIQALEDGKVIKEGDTRHKKIAGFICSDCKDNSYPRIGMIIHLDECQILEPETKPVRCKCGNEAELLKEDGAVFCQCPVCLARRLYTSETKQDGVGDWNKFQETYEPEVKLFDVRENKGVKYAISFLNEDADYCDVFQSDGQTAEYQNKSQYNQHKLLARCSSLKEATEFMFGEDNHV